MTGGNSVARWRTRITSSPRVNGSERSEDPVRESSAALGASVSARRVCLTIGRPARGLRQLFEAYVAERDARAEVRLQPDEARRAGGRRLAPIRVGVRELGDLVAVELHGVVLPVDGNLEVV